MAMSHHKRILFSTLDFIEFEEDETTTFRRINPRYQLNCLGEYCDQYGFERVECKKKKNLNTQQQQQEKLYQSSHWDCVAYFTDLDGLEEKVLLMDDQFQLDCEGWRHDEDPYILQGSCALDYTFSSAKTLQNQTTILKTQDLRNDQKSVWFFTSLSTFFILFITMKLLKINLKPTFKSIFFVILMVFKCFKIKIQITIDSLKKCFFGESIKVSNLDEKERSD